MNSVNRSLKETQMPDEYLKSVEHPLAVWKMSPISLQSDNLGKANHWGMELSGVAVSGRC